MHVERDARTAYSVESLGISACAHSQPSKMLECDWLPIERSRDDDPNCAATFRDGEEVRFADDKQSWIVVKAKRRGRSCQTHLTNKAITVRSPRRNVFRGREHLSKIKKLMIETDALITKERGRRDEYEKDKREVSTSAIEHQNKTDPKRESRSRSAISIVQSGCG